jgi:hypothetical protein
MIWKKKRNPPIFENIKNHLKFFWSPDSKKIVIIIKEDKSDVIFVYNVYYKIFEKKIILNDWCKKIFWSHCSNFFITDYFKFHMIKWSDYENYTLPIDFQQKIFNLMCIKEKTEIKLPIQIWLNIFHYLY